MERDCLNSYVNELIRNFNSHAHVERDAVVCKGFEQAQDFNSHAHVERDDEAISGKGSMTAFQLTRSRGA